ncbi:hypothetical protein P7C70_g627, partial [Phenoliferia sp. Uapishka_3]
MVAGMIGDIGLLSKVQMERFPELFTALKTEGSTNADKAARVKATATLAPFRELAKQQIAAAGGFLIKVVGVFDTVGSLGLPTELHKTHPHAASLFGFSNTVILVLTNPVTKRSSSSFYLKQELGSHIELALHALALNETRKDFLPTLWTQTLEGQQKGQVLKQVWFAGSHADIGGGWPAHDLSDLTLAWMVSHTQHILSYDTKYIDSIRDPTALYGQQTPHNPRTGMMALSAIQHRTPPTETIFPSLESIHHSVPLQPYLDPAISQAITANKSLIQPLIHFEQEFQNTWRFEPAVPRREGPQTLANITIAKESNTHEITGYFQRVVGAAESVVERLSGFKVHGDDHVKQ